MIGISRTAKRYRPLRPGDVVEVRPPSEILATLASDASLGAMPFMPEMLQYVGKRFTVSRRVEKICDTARGTYSSRRMRSTVLLEDLRCDGSGHGGCQAGCRVYWKEAWLRRVDADDGATEVTRAPDEELERLASAAATRGDVGDSSVTYRCQATEAPVASEDMGRADVRQYVREVRARNVTLRHLVAVLARAVWLKAYRLVSGHRGRSATTAALPTPGIVDVRLGDVVRIRPLAEIAASLDEHGMNRGLWFDDAEMARHCGETHRVLDRVERIIDEGSGKMIEIAGDCLILEGVCCSGELTPWRWFCPRGIHAYWREAWLSAPGEDASSR